MAEKTALELAGGVWADVESLLEHHPAAKEEKPKPGRPQGSYGHLMRASVSLCYTGWEVFVEECLLETVERLLSAGDASDLPEALRSFTASKAADPWVFVGEGWKDAVRTTVRLEVKGDEKNDHGLNTASVYAVSKLYKSVLGYSPMHEIKWQKKSNDAVRRHLQRLVSERGEIVHSGSTPTSLGLGQANGYLDFVRRLAEQFDKSMRSKFQN